MYTHCPNCDTYFSITQEHLKLANGKVRCGNCSHVFNATNSLYDELPKNASNKDVPVIPETKAPPKTESFGMQGLDIKAKMERITASLSAATNDLKKARENSFSFTQPASNFQPTITPPPVATPQPAAPDPAAPTVPEPEAISEPEPVVDDLDILTDVQEENITTGQDEFAPPPQREDEPFGEDEELLFMDSDFVETSEKKDVSASMEDIELIVPDDEVSNDTEEENEALLTDFSRKRVDEEDIEILHSLMDDMPEGKSDDRKKSELMHELDEINESLTEHPSSRQKDLASLDDEFVDLEDSDDLLDELDSIEENLLQENRAKAKAAEKTSVTTQKMQDDSAVQEPSESKPRATPRKEEEVVPSFLTSGNQPVSQPAKLYGWMAGSIAMLVVLFFQYIHFNSLDLAQDSSFRPWLETICPITGCDLPLYRDPQQIVTVNHDVRTHPKIKNALSLSLEFKNKADQNQAYPDVEITFSNRMGDIVAQRAFRPEEYLSDKSIIAKGINSSQTIEMQIELVDPKPDELLSFQFVYK